MQVIVTVKETAGVADDFEIDGTEISDSDLEYDLNEWDDYAVETAVQLAEAGIADEVVTVTIGPERSEETIRMALAKGADRAIRVWDDDIDRSALLDTSVRVDLLEAIIERENPDLVLSGVQASDTAFASTGVALAERAGYAWGAVVNDLDLDDAGVANVRRELEGGVEELTEIDLPAVLTIQTGINEPRYASLRGIRQAQSKELIVYDLGELDLDDPLSGDLRLTEMYEPETESEAEMWDGSSEIVANQLADLPARRG